MVMLNFELERQKDHHEGVAGIDFVDDSFGAVLACGGVSTAAVANFVAAVDSISGCGNRRKCNFGAA